MPYYCARFASISMLIATVWLMPEHCLGRRGKHQIEVAPIDWVGRYRPARPTRVVDRRQQFHMKRGRLRHAVHREVAKNIATLRAGPFHAAALECDLREISPR